MTVSGIKYDEPARKTALLLHLAGSEVQGVFSTLDDTGDERAYNTALEELNAHYLTAYRFCSFSIYCIVLVIGHVAKCFYAGLEN